MKIKRTIICFILIVLVLTNVTLASANEINEPQYNMALNIISRYFNMDIETVKKLIESNMPLKIKDIRTEELIVPEIVKTQEDFEIVILDMLYNETYYKVIKTDLDNDKEVFINALYNVKAEYVEFSDFIDRIMCSVKTDYVVIKLINSSLNSEEIIEIQREFFNKTEEIAEQLVIENNITGNTTDKEKALIAFNWVKENSRYDNNLNDESYLGYYLLTTGKGVCQAYASVYNALLEMLGVECEGVTGNYGRYRHILTYANIDGEWFYIDATFVDEYSYKSEKFFCLTREEIEKYHRFDE